MPTIIRLLSTKNRFLFTKGLRVQNFGQERGGDGVISINARPVRSEAYLILTALGEREGCWSNELLSLDLYVLKAR